MGMGMEMEMEMVFFLRCKHRACHEDGIRSVDERRTFEK